MTEQDRAFVLLVEQATTEAVWWAQDAGVIGPDEARDLVRLATDSTLAPAEVALCVRAVFPPHADEAWRDLIQAWMGFTVQVRINAGLGWPVLRWRDVS